MLNQRLGLSRFVYSIGILALATLPAIRGAQAASPANSGDGIGTPHYTTAGSVTNFSANAHTVPYFRAQFTDPTNGVTYPYNMVGTNPSAGDHVTTVPTVIIPFSFTFAVSADPAVHTLDGSMNTGLTAASPVFQASNVGEAASSTASAPPSFAAGRKVKEPSDVTQLADAIFRAEWGKTGSGYHILLNSPAIMPVQSFSVPSNQGQILVGSSSHVHIGLLDANWFSDRLNQAINNLHIDAGTLPIVLAYNVFLYTGDNPANCCILGYHGAGASLNGNGQQQVQTYIFAAYSDPGIFAPNPGDTISYVQDIHALSHEVQEWVNDPFGNNVVTPWLTPTAPQYGCTNLLEVGDPVVGYGFEIKLGSVTYHPEDETHFSWFARESPSRAEGHYYTYLNNFPTVAAGCQ